MVSIGHAKSSLMLAIAIFVALSCLVTAAQEAGTRGIEDSVVTTLAGGNFGDGFTNARQVPLDNLAGGIARDTAGNIYFTEGQRIVKLTPAGVFSVVAGTKTVSGFRGEGDLAVNSLLNTPTLLASDSAGNIYVLDSANNRIRRINAADGKIVTVAGNGPIPATGSSNVIVTPLVNAGDISDVGQLAINARLSGKTIIGLAVDSAGNLFFADSATQVVYEVAAATGLLSAVAGNGTTGFTPAGKIALGNPLNTISGLAVLASGDLVYSETNAIRQVKLSSDGTNAIVAAALDDVGNPVAAPQLFPDDGSQPALQSFSAKGTGGVLVPVNLTVDGANIIFYDSVLGRIRSFTIGGNIKTVFGEVGERVTALGYRGDGVPAAPNTPRKGICIRPGADENLDSTPGGDDIIVFDAGLNEFVIEAGPNGICDTTATGTDIQVVPVGTASSDDYTLRNDDPQASIFSGGLVASGGVVTFVDEGNRLIRQFTVGGNVATIAGSFSPIRFANTSNLVPPTITSTLSASATQGTAFSYQVTAAGPAATFGSSGLGGTGLSLDGATGIISGTPVTNGIFPVILSATDAGGTTNSTLLLTILPVAGAPVISSPVNVGASEGAAFTYTIAASNAPTSFGAPGLPAGLTLNAATGAITGTPAMGSAGLYNLVVSATNAAGTGFANLNINIGPAATAPVINSALTAMGTEGAAFTYTIAATNTPTTFNVFSTLPAGLTLANATGVISGTPAADSNGVYNIFISATNATGTNTQTLVLTILPPGNVPAISSPTFADGTVGFPFSYTITATNSPTTFAAAGLPANGLTLNAATGVISGTLNASGSLILTISATNGTGTGRTQLTIGEASLPGSTAVGNGNAGFSQLISDNAPVSARGALIASPGQLAQDAAGNVYFDAVDYYSNTKILKYDPAAKAVSVVAGPVYTNGNQVRGGNGGPAVGVALGSMGTTVNLIAGDAFFFTEPTQDIAWMVDPTGNATVIAGINGVSGGSFPDADHTLLDAAGNPTQANSRVGQMATGINLNTPSAILGSSATAFTIGDTGNNRLVAVTSGMVTKDIPLGFSPSFLVQLTPTVILAASAAGASGPPIVTSAPTGSGTQGQLFSYQIQAIGLPTAYSVVGVLPAGVAVNAVSGLISGTPTNNGVFNVVLRAANGSGFSEFPFTINIAPIAGAPVISSPATASGTVGAVFATYTIAASNAPTSFTSSALPAGLALNALTGAITGTPTVAGKTNVTINAINATGTGSTLLVFTINSGTVPVNISGAPLQAVLGVPYSFQVLGTDAPTGYTLTAGSALPAGLSLNTTTGLISGTPLSGTTTASINIANAAGSININVTIVVVGASTVTRIDVSGAVPAITPLGPGIANITGMALGTNGIFLSDANSITLFDSVTGAAKYVVPNLGNITGLFAAGTTVRFALNTGTIQEFADNGASAPAAASIVTRAGKFFTLFGDGGINLQSGFEFKTTTPLAAFANGDQFVGDDGVLQFRRVVYGATPPSATATVVAGSGNTSAITGDKGPATSALLGTVGGIAVGSDGTLYFSESNNNLIRSVAANTITRYSGIPGLSGYSGGTLNRLSTVMNAPAGLALGPAGELYIVSSGDNTILKVRAADGVVVLVSGQPGESGYAGDTQAANLAFYASPRGCAFDKNGDFFVADTGNDVIRVISSAGVVDTIAGNSNGHNVAQQVAPSLQAGLGSVAAVALDTAGKIYSVTGSQSSSSSKSIPTGVSNAAAITLPVNSQSSSTQNTVDRSSGGLSQAVVGVGNTSGFNGDGLPGLQTVISSNPSGVLFVTALGLVFTDTGNGRLRAVGNLAEKTNTPPTAVIVVTPDFLGVAPLKVHFDGSTSTDPDGDIISYVWNFGDGSTGNGSIVDHTYTAVGSFNVTLTVTDSAGNASVAKTVVFAAQPIISSSTTGKGAFKIAFGPKATKPTDLFALVVSNVAGLTDETGKSATITIGSFTTTAVVAGKGVKTTSKTVKLTIDPVKKTISLAIKGVKLASAFADLGVLNTNTVAAGKGGTASVLIPVVININSGAIVIGDKFLFAYRSKFNSGASGSFAQ